MKPTDKQLHICELWCIEAGERYTGATILEDGNMVVYVLQRAITMSTTTIITMWFVYDPEGKLVDLYTPGIK